jgi:CBS domain containing-hemolysin-like protein
MYDPLTIVLTIAVILLISVIVVTLVMVIVVLFTIKKTLAQLQNAISNVEDTAMRSLAPLLSFRAMFSDTRHFVEATTKVLKVLQGKKSK